MYGVAPKFAREESAKLVLFNPLVIKITVEGGKSMDYTTVQYFERGRAGLFCELWIPVKKK